MSLSVQGFGSNSPTTIGFGGGFSALETTPKSMIYHGEQKDIFKGKNITDKYIGTEDIDS